MRNLIAIKNFLIEFIISMLKEVQTIHLAVGSNELETIMIKFNATIKLAIFLSPLTLAIDQFMTWTTLNMGYILFVLGAVILDHAFGTYKHLIIDRDFTWPNNIKGLFLKLAMVVAGAFLFEGINHIIAKGSIIKDYIEIVFRLIVFLYPAGSAFGNMTVVTNGKFPPKAWMDRLERFKTNLDPMDLKGKNNKNE